MEAIFEFEFKCFQKFLTRTTFVVSVCLQIAKVILLQCLAHQWICNVQYATQRKAAVVLKIWTQAILVQQLAAR